MSIAALLARKQWRSIPPFRQSSSRHILGMRLLFVGYHEYGWVWRHLLHNDFGPPFHGLLHPWRLGKAVSRNPPLTSESAVHPVLGHVRKLRAGNSRFDRVSPEVWRRVQGRTRETAHRRLRLYHIRIGQSFPSGFSTRGSRRCGCGSCVSAQVSIRPFSMRL